MKKLLLSLLFMPVMASANHCADLSMMSGAMLEGRKSGVSHKHALDIFYSVKAPSDEAQNESLSILTWVYSVPKDTSTYELMNAVMETCEEFYGE